MRTQSLTLKSRYMYVYMDNGLDGVAISKPIQYLDLEAYIFDIFVLKSFI